MAVLTWSMSSCNSNTSAPSDVALSCGSSVGSAGIGRNKEGGVECLPCSVVEESSFSKRIVYHALSCDKKDTGYLMGLLKRKGMLLNLSKDIEIMV